MTLMLINNTELPPLNWTPRGRELQLTGWDTDAYDTG